MGKRQVIIDVGLSGKIAHFFYTREEAEKVFSYVEMLKGSSEHWIVELFNDHVSHFIVCPRETYFILRRYDFVVDGVRFEVQRYK